MGNLSRGLGVKNTYVHCLDGFNLKLPIKHDGLAFTLLVNDR